MYVLPLGRVYLSCLSHISLEYKKVFQSDRKRLTTHGVSCLRSVLSKGRGDTRVLVLSGEKGRGSTPVLVLAGRERVPCTGTGVPPPPTGPGTGLLTGPVSGLGVPPSPKESA